MFRVSVAMVLTHTNDGSTGAFVGQVQSKFAKAPGFNCMNDGTQPITFTTSVLSGNVNGATYDVCIVVEHL